MGAFPGRVLDLGQMMSVASARGRNSRAPELWRGLYSLWPFVAGARNDVLSSRTLTLVDGATFRPTPLGRALHMAYSDPYESATFSSSPDLGSQTTWTWACLFRYEGSHDANARYLYLENAGGGDSLSVYHQAWGNNDLKFSFLINWTSFTITASAGLVPNTYQSAVFVRRAADDFEAWIDGVSVGTDSTTLGYDDTQCTPRIGYAADNNDNWQGDVAWMGFSRRAWSLA